MSFVLPQSVNKDSYPWPNDDKVKVKRVKGDKFAVLRYTGSLTKESIETNSEKLQRWIEENGYRVKESATAISAGYNPPWTIPSMRRNEVMIQIE